MSESLLVGLSIPLSILNFGCGFDVDGKVLLLLVVTNTNRSTSRGSIDTTILTSNRLAALSASASASALFSASDSETEERRRELALPVLGRGGVFCAHDVHTKKSPSL